MIGRVEAVAREVAQREGLSLLFKREEALYEADGADLAAIDITELVIRVLLDKINPSEIPKARKPGEPSEPEPTR
jgi:Skp family chaperone for outer membrane proteins